MMKKNSGFSLIEVLISVSLLAVMLTAFIAVFQSYSKQEQNFAFNERKQDLLVNMINIINNDVAWQKTVDRFGTSSNPNSLDCLKDKGKFPSVTNAGACNISTDGGLFTLLNDAGEIILDNTNASSGFSLYGGACSTYDSAGSDTCPLRVEVRWRPLCVTCGNNQVEITIEIKDTPKLRSSIMGPSLIRKLVRYNGIFDPDLVLFLKLDEPTGATGVSLPMGTVVNDSSSYKNNGAIAQWPGVGADPTYQSGQVGQGVEFVDYKYISIPDSPTLRPGADITVAAWVKLTSAPASTLSGIVDKRVENSQDSYALRKVNSNFEFCVAEKFGDKCASGSIGGISVGTWYYVVGTWDSKDVRIYINGAQVGSVFSYNGPNYWSADPVIIGAENQSDTFYRFPGVIDQVKIWKRALKATEILSEYNNP